MCIYIFIDTLPIKNLGPHWFLHTHTHTHTHTHIYIYIYTCKYFIYIYIYIYIDIYIYIYIYRYHTVTDVDKAALLPTKPSSDDDSGFRYGFGAETSLPLAQRAPAVSHDTTRLCRIVVTQWDCHIHTDAVRGLPWIFFYISPPVLWRVSKISQEYRGWVGNETSAFDLDRKYVGYPAISDTLFLQILMFFQLTQLCPDKIFFKRDH